jgi:resuscitation-promoting factor RpfB
VRKIIPAVAAGAAMLTFAGSTYAYAVLDKNVELSVDGATSHVSTMAGTVEQVLSSKGLDVSHHDVVVPGLDTKVVDGTRITVLYARQVTVTVDGKPRTYWTTATNVAQALAALKLDLPGAQLSTSRSTPIGREGFAFNLATLRTLTVDDGGKPRSVKSTAPTIGAALAAAKITVDADDRLSTSPTTRLTNGAKITITRVEVKKVTKTKPVDHATRYSDTDDLDRGDTKVKARGKDGVRTIVYTEVWHNGKLKSRKQTSSKITTKPRAEVVLRGTRVAEEESESNATSGSSSDKSGSGGSAAASSGGGTRGTAFVTGYSYWDNTPPGSAQISHPVLHSRAGGSGTYGDPITVAVGYDSSGPDFAYGTRFYLPDLDKYFIVEDICGACGSSRSGTDYTLDIWVDGSDTSSSGVRSCMNSITGAAPVIRNPSSGLPVDSGPVC